VLLWRRPGLAIAAALPEIAYETSDALWLGPIGETQPFLAVLALPIGIFAHGWTLALMAAAWEATDQTPARVVLSRAGSLGRAMAVAVVVIFVGLPLVAPAIYYYVHYLYVPIVAVRDPSRRPLAVLRRSKLLARKHRGTTLALTCLYVAFTLALQAAFDRSGVDNYLTAVARAVSIALCSLALAATAAQAYARWKAVDTMQPET